MDDKKKGTPVLYYVDGFHGGIKGHMPAGSWRDILNGLEEHPNWKISLDIEPISWDDLRRKDPETFYMLKEYAEAPYDSVRVEIVAASYAQPFAWVVGGESNIRHLQRGMQLVKESFPGAVVDTYAVQEPCWTSSMPQMLRSMGFRRAVLKNSTNWGGYSAGVPYETVNWKGSDGSVIPAVPRYSCEELIDASAVECSGYDRKSFLLFPEKCVKNGIMHPAGVCFQDLGWGGRPWASDSFIRNTTWREYMDRIAEPPSENWYLTQEDILCTLPWGEKTLQRMSRQVRNMENKILTTEKIAAFAHTFSSTFVYPKELLVRAWDQLMLSQHHDAWICATAGFGRKNWAWQADAETWIAEEYCDEILAGSLDALQNKKGGGGSKNMQKLVRVYNTLPYTRQEAVTVGITTKPGTKDIAVKDRSGKELPSQYTVTRRYAADQSINQCELTFIPLAEGMGDSTYQIELSDAEAAEHSAKGVFARVTGDRVLEIHSDIYDLELDLRCGGILKKIYEKTSGKEFIDPESKFGFNEYRGYFIEEGRFRSSVEHPVSVKIMENGPCRVKVQLDGLVADAAVSTVLTVCQGSPRLDFDVSVHFTKDTWVGEAWDLKPEDRMTERKKSNHDDRWKLQAMFPSTIRHGDIYKNAAFDVCRSKLENTFFSGWDQIKHNIILNWVDLYDADSNYGLALFSGHTTSYLHGKEKAGKEEYPLALTLAWGYEAGFWWGKSPLQGVQNASYSIIPHQGIWKASGLSARNAALCEPLFGMQMDLSKTEAEKELDPRTFLKIEESGFEVTTILVEEDAYLIRVLNMEAASECCTLRFSRAVKLAEAIELNGDSITRLDFTDYEVLCRIQPFAFCTVKVVFA